MHVRCLHNFPSTVSLDRTLTYTSKTYFDWDNGTITYTDTIELSTTGDVLLLLPYDSPLVLGQFSLRSFDAEESP